MADMRGAEPLGHAHPDIQERFQFGGPVSVEGHELIEHQPFHPLHLEYRKPLTVDADSLFKIVEVHNERHTELAQMTADFAVALAQAGDLARKAFDGPARAAGALDLVDIGEVAGAGQ